MTVSMCWNQREVNIYVAIYAKMVTRNMKYDEKLKQFINYMLATGESYGVLGEISVADVATFKGVGLLFPQLVVFGGHDCLVSDLPFVLVLGALLQGCLFAGVCASFLSCLLDFLPLVGLSK